jgi:2-(1,2-epoxy-1,2-dihydrophenyl)acetyl-CoA isomerase
MAVLKVERHGAVVLMTFDRPEALNALGREGDGAEVAAACAEINADHSVRAAILTGAGKAFSAGGDIKAMQERSGAFAANGVAIREGYRRNIHSAVRALYSLEIPLIAAVNGAAIGLGCGLAGTADIRISSSRAIYSASFLKLGLVPGDGGAWMLPRLVGMSRAAELLFTAKSIDAATALAWGLVSEVVEPDVLIDRALELACEIAQQPPHALRLTKNLLRQGQIATFDMILELSVASQAISHLTEDHMEGVNAMLERRPAVFVGR